MKIAIMADCHLNDTTYSFVKDKVQTHLPFRTIDFMTSFGYLVQKIIENGVDMLVIVGDAFDNAYPHSDVSAFFNKQLCLLQQHSINTVVLTGNHDISRQSNALKPLKSLKLPFAKIVDEPLPYLFGDYLCLFFPYSMDVEQRKISVRQQLDIFIKQTKKDIAEKILPDLPILFFGHFGVQGAVMSQSADKQPGITTENSIRRLSKNMFRGSGQDLVTCNDLQAIGAKYIFLGDYHKHQTLAVPNTIAMYTGSIEKTDSGEMGVKKGCILFDSQAEADKKLGQCRFIEYPNCRPFVELRGAWRDIKEGCRGLNDTHKGAIVKIHAVGTKLEVAECASNLQRLKEWLVKKIAAVHILYEHTTTEEPEQPTIDAQGNVIAITSPEFRDGMEREAVQELITEQVKDEPLQKLMIKIADEMDTEFKGTK